jgi:hypothetical protein
LSGLMNENLRLSPFLITDKLWMSCDVSYCGPVRSVFHLSSMKLLFPSSPAMITSVLG